MSSEKLLHIFIKNYKLSGTFSPKNSGGSNDSPPSQDQILHGRLLETSYTNAIAYLDQLYQGINIDTSLINKGATLELKFQEGTAVDVSKLEKSKIEVLNVKIRSDNTAESAVIYIPEDKKDIMKKDIADYSNISKNTKKGNPANYTKYDRIETFKPASLEQLWLEHQNFPSDRSQKHTFEVWLRKGSFQDFKKVSQLCEVNVSQHKLDFPDREICSIHCNLEELDRINIITKAISRLRFLPTLSGFFDALPPSEQSLWSDDLSSRITLKSDVKTSVCVLDSGIMSEHKLLRNFIAPNGIDTCDPKWETADHNGHGTQMAGIALFGDNTKILESSDNISLNHSIEAIKVFPNTGQNLSDHIGYITSQAVSRSEINNPYFNRIFCLSWSMEHIPREDKGAVMQGKPTPLSAKIDQMALGVDYNQENIDPVKKRLFMISAGNIRDTFSVDEYININDLSEIEDPGQSWNALTVGAYTDKIFTNDPNYNGWKPVAQCGDLSPKSRTSVLWGESYWPNKPDIVVEGGNYLVSPHQLDYFHPHPDTTILTTDKDNFFSCTRDTSAANAEASRLAAIVSAQYPDYWPETIRALMVHSAEWTQKMQEYPFKKKMEKITCLRRYGYGVPQEQNLLNSFQNKPCLVVQDTIRPFKKGKPNVKFNEINHYKLPWPKEQLEAIYDKNVKLRVTLSYFIEPNPSERPPKTKYSYASHGLRFKLKRPNEEKDAFLKRVGHDMEREENDLFNEQTVNANSDNEKWILGPQTRDRGNIISDIWEGTAAELANQNMIAITPQSGWWKFRDQYPSKEKPRYLEEVRYSLIVSLITEEDIDLYTPIMTEIKSKIII